MCLYVSELGIPGSQWRNGSLKGRFVARMEWNGAGLGRAVEAAVDGACTSPVQLMTLALNTSRGLWHHQVSRAVARGKAKSARFVYLLGLPVQVRAMKRSVRMRMR